MSKHLILNFWRPGVGNPRMCSGTPPPGPPDLGQVVPWNAIRSQSLRVEDGRWSTGW